MSEGTGDMCSLLGSAVSYTVNTYESYKRLSEMMHTSYIGPETSVLLKHTIYTAFVSLDRRSIEGIAVRDVNMFKPTVLLDKLVVVEQYHRIEDAQLLSYHIMSSSPGCVKQFFGFTYLGFWRGDKGCHLLRCKSVLLT